MRKCIYCLCEKQTGCFNREHVIPEAFGTFKGNFVLHNLVCEECNKYFGDNLDIILSRGTIEGTHRFQCGAKKPSDFKEIHAGRIEIRVKEAGPWQGALGTLMYSKDQDKVVFDLLDQIGIFNANNSSWVFFTPDTLPPIDKVLEDGFVLPEKRAYKIIFKDDQSYHTICDALEQKGYKKPGNENEKLPYDIAGRNVDVEMASDYDEYIARAIGKIAMNYLAHQTFSIYPPFIYKECFNNIRAFIRYGRAGENYHIEPKREPILYQEKGNPLKIFGGHLMTLNWDASHRKLFSYVSLFNRLTYLVVFCEDYTDISFDLPIGHSFDIGSKSICRLHGFSKSLLP